MSHSKGRKAAAGRTPHSKRDDGSGANRYVRVPSKSINRLLADIEKRDKTIWRQIMGNVFYPITSFFRRLPFNIKMWWQRRTRGYSDDELWSLDYSLLEWFLPRLRAFTTRKRCGYPARLDRRTTGYCKNGEKKWQNILDKILWSFEYANQMINSQGPIHDKVFHVGKKFKYNRKTADKYWKQYKEGMELFSEYLMNIWD